MAPAADFAWDQRELADSCSMANIAPQLPGLNRKQWERLEETVRSWALDRSKLVIFVGPILQSGEDTIGADHVVVPVMFWKVIVDPEHGEALSFEMEQEDIPKAPLAPWETSVAKVEADAGIELPLPAGIDKNAVPKLWKTNLTRWRRQHRDACAALE